MWIVCSEIGARFPVRLRGEYSSREFMCFLRKLPPSRCVHNFARGGGEVVLLSPLNTTAAMDVSHVLQEYTDSKHAPPRAAPAETDPALLAAFDNSPTDPAAYADLEPHLLQLTLASTHSLLAALFALPTTPSPSGPLTAFPAPTTLLPREKHLPKPKPLTKWERFANEKGISHKKKEKDVWDEERQEWVPRWGRFGKNKDKEDQWLHEVKPGEGQSIPLFFFDSC